VPAAADPATDVLDQQNAGLTVAHARCADAGRSLYQAFRPRATPLVAIAIEAREVPLAGDTAHLRIRAGAPDGPVVGETHVAIPAAGGWVRAEFTNELLVELDGYYVIEWVNPTAWWACRDDDPYARGEAYNCAGAVMPYRDFNFRTWAPATHWELRTWGQLKRRLAGIDD
jgi:hypothetical protein